VKQALPERFPGDRNFSTAIYFLLRSQDRSAFHKIKSDELWHFHAGTSLSIYVIQDGVLAIHKLGSNPDKGESLQVVIPANCWFGAKVEQPDSYTLSGCTVAPGFDFRDFELAERKMLSKQFPDLAGIIEMLT
jgi:predicted cupin superfamily sugar epimerase